MLVFFLLLCYLGSGCSEGTYLAEKKFYHANRRLLELIKDKKQLDPSDERIDDLIFDFKEITMFYPYWDRTMHAHYKLAGLYELKKNYKAAKGEYEIICKHFVKDRENCANALRSIANLYELEENWLEAERMYMRIASEYPYTIVGLLVRPYLARYYYKNGQKEKSERTLEDAVIFYKQAIEANISDAVAISSIEFAIDCYRHLGQPKQAFEFLDYLAAKYPDSVVQLRAFFHLAEFFKHSTDKKEKAIEYYQLILEKYPDAMLAKEAKQEIEKLTKQVKQ